jgi:protein disulfide-isomerase
MKRSFLHPFIAVVAGAMLSSFAGFSATAAESKEGGGAAWLNDYEKAIAQAKAENKSVLLDFTGSDWCGWCIKMVDETLSKKEFVDYAGKNLVLVEVDFPNKKQLSEETKKQNEELKKKFGAQGFPTFVLVDKEGKELGKQVGYMPGGPSAFIAKLESFKSAKTK